MTTTYMRRKEYRWSKAGPSPDDTIICQDDGTYVFDDGHPCAPTIRTHSDMRELVENGWWVPVGQKARPLLRGGGSA